MRMSFALLSITLLICPTAPADDDPVTVSFHVTVPSNTPAGSGIFLAGNAAQLGGWTEDGVALAKRPDGTYAVQLKLPRGEPIEYKVTRGTWGTVEKNGDDSEMANRSFTPTHKGTVEITVAAWADRAATTAPSRAAKPTKTGDIRTHEAFHSTHLNNDRALFVWLPPEYETQQQRRYPVLYMHDGQNVFDAATSFAGEWQADETAARLIADGKIRPLIVVGISNNASRMNEYTLTRDAGYGEGGNGANYLKFIVDEVKPFIDRTYRTSNDRANTAIAGSSLGGTISLEACRAYPKTFGACAAISPAAWWNNGELLDRFDRDVGWMRHCRFWIDTGTAEGKPSLHAAYVEAARRLEAILKKAGLRAERDYAVRIVEGGLHNEQAWAKRFDQVLMFLFPP